MRYLHKLEATYGMFWASLVSLKIDVGDGGSKLDLNNFFSHIFIGKASLVGEFEKGQSTLKGYFVMHQTSPMGC